MVTARKRVFDRFRRSTLGAYVTSGLFIAIAVASIATSETTADRLPLPTDTVARQVIAEVQDVFRKEYATANTPQEKSALAKQLASAAEKNANPLDRWGMLSEAGRLAADAGDVETAFAVVETLSESYQANRMTLELEAIGRMATRATVPVARDLAQRTLEICKTLVGKQAFYEANQVADIMPKLLVKARDRSLSNEFRTLQVSMEKQRRAAEEQAKEDAQRARKRAQMLKLASESADDPKVSLEVGTYFCFQANEWELGLPLLANASDKDLAAVVQTEAAAQNGLQLLEAAEEWMRWAEAQKDDWKAPGLDRAAFLLTRLASQASGLDKIRIEKALAEVRERRSKVQGMPERGFDSDALDYIRRVETADGQSLELRVQVAINEFVKGCKADGIWDAIKASCILCGARTLNGALVPLVGTAPTPNNFVSDDYNRITGLSDPQATSWLDSGRAANADSDSDHHIAAYMTQGTAPAGIYMIGAMTTVSSYTLAGSGAFSRTPTVSGLSETGTGLYGVSRDNDSDFDYIKASGGVLQSARPVVAASLSNGHTVFGFTLYDGAAAGLTDARLAFYSIGSALDLAALDARVSTLVASIGTALP